MKDKSSILSVVFMSIFLLVVIYKIGTMSIPYLLREGLEKIPQVYHGEYIDSDEENFVTIENGILSFRYVDWGDYQYYTKCKYYLYNGIIKAYEINGNRLLWELTIGGYNDDDLILTTYDDFFPVEYSLIKQ